MAGTPVVASFLAQATFWMLTAYGVVSGELPLMRGGIFAALWLAGRVGVPRVFFDPYGTLFSSFVALLDIVLVLMIFKRDIRLR